MFETKQKISAAANICFLKNTQHPGRSSYSLRARGVSTAAARLLFFYRNIQLSTTTIFCRFLKNVVLLSTVFSF